MKVKLFTSGGEELGDVSVPDTLEAKPELLIVPPGRFFLLKQYRETCEDAKCEKTTHPTLEGYFAPREVFQTAPANAPQPTGIVLPGRGM